MHPFLPPQNWLMITDYIFPTNENKSNILAVLFHFFRRTTFHSIKLINNSPVGICFLVFFFYRFQPPTYRDIFFVKISKLLSVISVIDSWAVRMIAVIYWFTHEWKCLLYFRWISNKSQWRAGHLSITMT